MWKTTHVLNCKFYSIVLFVSLSVLGFFIIYFSFHYLFYFCFFFHASCLGLVFEKFLLTIEIKKQQQQKKQATISCDKHNKNKQTTTSVLLRCYGQNCILLYFKIFKTFETNTCLKMLLAKHKVFHFLLTVRLKFTTKTICLLSS